MTNTFIPAGEALNRALAHLHTKFAADLIHQPEESGERRSAPEQAYPDKVSGARRLGEREDA